MQFTGQRARRAFVYGPFNSLRFGRIDIHPGTPHGFKNIGQVGEAVAGMHTLLRIPENRDFIVAVDPFHITDDYTSNWASRSVILYNIRNTGKEMKKMRLKLLIASLAALVLFALPCGACSLLPQQGFTYDPSKSYASFLVLDNETARSSLATMKQRSVAEGLEIGPVEFYKQGTKDFAPVLKKLTSSKQVVVVWIISSIWDVNDIKKGMEGLDYSGPFRYVPISEEAGPIKIQQ